MHMPSLLTKTVTLFTLVSLLAIVFFSFSLMARGVDGQMQGDCPFSVMGVPLCPQDAFAAAVHHISAYQSFLNIIASSGVTALIVTLVLAVCAALAYSAGLLGFAPAPPMRLVRVPLSSALPKRKVLRWLSLFENSPSIA